MNITFLVDDEMCRNFTLRTEHGLALIIEMEAERVSFNTDQVGKACLYAEK